MVAKIVNYSLLLRCLLLPMGTVAASSQKHTTFERPAAAAAQPHHLLNALEAPCSASEELRETFYELDPVSRVKLGQKLSARHSRDIRDYLSSCLVSPREDYTAVHSDIVIWAAQKGFLDVVVFLVEEKGASVHVHDDLPLRFAAQNGHLAMVKYLISQGSNPAAAGGTALLWSQKEGHSDVYRYLQSVGARSSNRQAAAY